MIYEEKAQDIVISGFSRALGDCLLISALLPHLSLRKSIARIAIQCEHPELYKHNPYVFLTTKNDCGWTCPLLKPKYTVEKETRKHIVKQMLESVGVMEDGHPELYLTPQEMHETRCNLPSSYIAICPKSKIKFASNRKEWGVDKFQEIIRCFPSSTFVQIGYESDPLLNGVLDRRGLQIRESAAIIANSSFFLGLEGGLMHLSRALNKRSAIIFGGYVRPDIAGYKENLNISSEIHCSPCCHSDRKHDPCLTMDCMKIITVDAVCTKLIDQFGWCLSH